MIKRFCLFLLQKWIRSTAHKSTKLRTPILLANRRGSITSRRSMPRVEKLSAWAITPRSRKSIYGWVAQIHFYLFKTSCIERWHLFPVHAVEWKRSDGSTAIPVLKRRWRAGREHYSHGNAKPSRRLWEWLQSGKNSSKSVRIFFFNS